MNKKWLIWILQYFVGTVFILSGIIKANDPLGFSYKLQEYFEVFNLSFFNSIALYIAIIISILEVLLGGLLLLGIFKKITFKGLFAMIIFFTVLTFFSAAFNVVTSCGCFGDAIPLTPWQSFLKDIILFISIIYLYINRQSLNAHIKGKNVKTLSFSLLLILPFLYSLYTYFYLPIIDFLPYKIGANIPDLMKLPKNAKVDEYSIIYHLRNKESKLEKKVNDKEYIEQEIWKDNNWEIIGKPERKLMKKGFDVKIKDLIISNSDGIDYTKEIIENPYYNLILVSFNIQDVQTSYLEEYNLITKEASENFNIRSVVLTSSSIEDISQKIPLSAWHSEIFFVDAIPLKSMIRSNPGLILMKNGIIINKWSKIQFPTYNELKESYFAR